MGAGSPELIDGPVPLVQLTVEGRPLSVAVVPLFDVAADGETTRRRVDLEHQLSAAGAGSVALWVPPGATIAVGEEAPAGGGGVSKRVAAAAGALAAGERGEVGFPVTLELRRNGDEGTYMSVVGGLSPYWARFTNRVFGYYQLDSSAIHRLPEDADKVTQLIDFTVLVANGVRKTGGRAEVKAEDVWSLQRLEGLPGPVVAGPVVVTAAPGENVEDGTLVRRTLRAQLQAAVAALEAGAGRRGGRTRGGAGGGLPVCGGGERQCGAAGDGPGAVRGARLRLPAGGREAQATAGAEAGVGVGGRGWGLGG